jgi:HPt (histidine-containing phosphotransfer) domain-containing protein
MTNSQWYDEPPYIALISPAVVEMCRELQEELRGGAIAGSGPYIQYLEASVEEKNLPPHPLDSHLTESITQLQQKIQLCEREVGEWDSLMVEKKRESQEATHDLESNLSVDWSQLRPEDEAKLATHLTQEQRDWLEHATSQREDAEWEKHTEEDLRTASSLIDAELARIQIYCDSVLQQCAVDTNKLIAGSITQTETPRTLFRAFKDTH